MTFWEGFRTGALVAVVYNLWKNPGGCACCAVLLLLLIAVVVLCAVALVMAVWPYIFLGLVLWGAALAARAVWRQYHQ